MKKNKTPARPNDTAGSRPDFRVVALDVLAVDVVAADVLAVDRDVRFMNALANLGLE